MNKTSAKTEEKQEEPTVCGACGLVHAPKDLKVNGRCIRCKELLGDEDPKLETLCSVCGGRQYKSEGGEVCLGEHGGADPATTEHLEGNLSVLRQALIEVYPNLSMSSIGLSDVAETKVPVRAALAKICIEPTKRYLEKNPLDYKWLVEDIAKILDAKAARAASTDSRTHKLTSEDKAAAQAAIGVDVENATVEMSGDLSASEKAMKRAAAARGEHNTERTGQVLEAHHRKVEMQEAMALVERETVSYTWGQESVQIVQFCTYHVGPFFASTKLRDGESIDDGMERLRKGLAPFVAKEHKRKLAEYTKTLQEAGVLK